MIYDLSKIYAFDSETSGLRPYMGDRMFAYCIGSPEGKVAVHRMDLKVTASLRSFARQKLENFFADTSIAKVMHNAKFDLTMVRMAGIKIPEDTTIHDTSVMAKLLRSDELHFSLDYLAWKYGHYTCQEDKVVAQYKDYRDVPIDIMTRYQRADGERTLLLLNMYLKHILADLRLKACYENEMELIKTTMDMESVGLMLNKREADMLEIDLDLSASEAQKTVNRVAGCELNVNSPKQLTALLFGKLNLPVIAYTKNGQYSTDKNTLLELKERTKHPVLDAILRIRSYVKGLGMLQGYRDNTDRQGMVHPNINTNGAEATGRQSCDNPNLQNVSKETNAKNPYAVPLRRCFRAKPMHFLLLCDYAGIQMRLMINATREPELMKILKANGDVHHPTMECFMMPSKYTVDGDEIFRAGIKAAADLKAKDPKEYKTQRNMFKNVGFGIGFGAGIDTTALTMGKKVREIMSGYENYQHRFPLQAAFSKSMIAQVKSHGYVETSFGRRLYAPRNMAYIGSNYLIQGDEAEIVKRAEVKVHKFLQREYGAYLQLIMVVHDELIFQGHRSILKELPEACAEIRRIMIDMPEIEAPLDVEYKMTFTSWDRAKGVDF